MVKLILILLVIPIIAATILASRANPSLPETLDRSLESPSPHTTKPTLISPPEVKTIPNNYHIFQSFNNCGPAALSMALSYYGVGASQQELGQSLRPYQISGGNNDDKSTTLKELAEKSKEYNLVPYHRPNGDIDKIKIFIAYDMPVITRTWTKVNEDIGHFRVVKGYTNTHLIQDDSLQNKNLPFSYSEFNTLWEKFNFEYLVLVPKDKVEIAEAILAEDLNEKVAWQKAVRLSENALSNNPNDVTARFNLSVALYNVGEIKRSTEEFEKIETRLPFRTLWYQIEPIQAYYELGNYERVFTITNRILNNQNKAFSELYIIRGNIYKNQGQLNLAKQEFVEAVFYNKNLREAKDALASVN